RFWRIQRRQRVRRHDETHLKSEPERRHALDVVRLRKHVERLDLLELVATVDQNAQVAGQGTRVARDIDHARRPRLEQCVQYLGVAPDARGIQDYRVWPHPERRQGVLGFRETQLHVRHLARVIAGVAQRGLRLLDRYDLADQRGGQKREGTDAGIGIDQDVVR